jgi:hypothetical protein
MDSQSLAALRCTAAGEFVAAEVVPLVRAVRQLQTPDGAVSRDGETASELLDRLVPAVAHAARLTGVAGLGDAFAADTRDWQARGLHAPPAYDRTVDSYRPPAGDGLTFFAGPLVATNGPAPRGHFMECFLAYRQEPEEVRALERTHPHPKNKCQSARLVYGSRGLDEGNCIVFFPENIAAAEKVHHQEYALFFFNKFRDIYRHLTVPVVERVFGGRDLVDGADRWRSATMEPADCYRARCVWGYLHDYYHHLGPRPLDQNLQVKMNWFVGLLEEIKVDCQTMLECMGPRIPFGAAVLQFALFERMLRYPQQPDWATNFDAGTGVLLFEWLARQGVFATAPDGRLTFERDALAGGLSCLVDRIVALEETPDDAEYRARARELVRDLLPASEVRGERFSMPVEYRRRIDAQPPARDLSFADLAY